MTVAQILAQHEEAMLKAMTPTQRTAQRRQWNGLEVQIRNAFTSPQIDVETLVRIATSGELRPTFQPTADRMLQHPDMQTRAQ